MSKLKLQAIGHLGRDCEVKHLDGGQCVISFSIATTETYKDKSGVKQSKTTWVDCVLWRKPETLKISEYLLKGTLVSVEGKPESRAWLSKEGTEARSILQVRVSELLLLGKGSSSTQADTSQPATNSSIDSGAGISSPASDGDDLPF